MGERVLIFGNGRSFHRESLVMYDLETGTDWIQASGEAFSGELEGQRLEVLPAAVVRLPAWAKAHPATGVMTGERSAYRRRQEVHVLDTKQRPLLSLLGRIGKEIRAYPLDAVDAHGLLEDVCDGIPVAVVAARDPQCLRLFKRSLGGTVIELELQKRAGALVLHERGGRREWDAISGAALGGGAALEALPAFPIRERKIRRLFPLATRYTPPPPAPPPPPPPAEKESR